MNRQGPNKIEDPCRESWNGLLMSPMVAKNTEGLNVKPGGFFISAKVIIFLGLFATVKTWKLIWRSQAARSNGMGNSPSGENFLWLAFMVKGSTALPAMIFFATMGGCHFYFCFFGMHFSFHFRYLAATVMRILNPSTIKTNGRKAICLQFIQPEAILRLPRLAYPAPFFAALELLLIFFKRKVVFLGCNLKNSQITAHSYPPLIGHVNLMYSI